MNTFLRLTVKLINSEQTNICFYFLVPTQPEVPEVISKGKGTISVRLKPVLNEFGPISKYRVVVSSEEGVLITHSSLKPWSQAQRERLPYYIAAELEPEVCTRENHLTKQISLLILNTLIN